MVERVSKQPTHSVGESYTYLLEWGEGSYPPIPLIMLFLLLLISILFVSFPPELWPYLMTVPYIDASFALELNED